MPAISYFFQIPGFNRLLLRVAKKLPTNRYLQFSPLRKLEILAKLKKGTLTGKRLTSKRVNQFLNEIPPWFESSIQSKIVSALPFHFRVSIPFSPYQALISQTSSSLTPLNAWRLVLYGKKGILKGRPPSKHRLTNLALRGFGAGSPVDLFKTVTTMYFLATAKSYYYTRKKVSIIETDSLVEAPSPPNPRDVLNSYSKRDFNKLEAAMLQSKQLRLANYNWSSHSISQPTVSVTQDPSPSSFRFGRQLGFENLVTATELRRQARRALQVMGMSSRGARSLIRGKAVYGVDSDIFNQICKLVFIVCDFCGRTVAIPQSEVQQALVYIPEAKALLNYCGQCKGFTSPKVLLLTAHQLIHKV